MTSHAVERSARRAFAAASAAATREGRTHWVALSGRIAPRDCLEIFAATGARQRFYWERPSEARALAASGSAMTIAVHGEARFGEAARAARDLFATLHHAGEPSPPQAGPLLIGGFAFAANAPGPFWRGFPACRLTLPEVLTVRHGERTWRTVVTAVEPGTDGDAGCTALLERLRRSSGPDGASRSLPARATTDTRDDAPRFRAEADRSLADYRARVAAALQAIASGDIEKVMLARSVVLRGGTPVDVPKLLADLRSAYPTCTTFAVGHGGGVFLGATPERLVRLEAGRVTTAAVAGSAPRGRNPADDERLGRELLESKKEQAEHAVVVRALRRALSDCCDDLELPESPRLLRLDGIQHLETPIRGVLRTGESILGLVARLHPTPAVGGAPRAVAQAWIARKEDLERGWYAGPVGFVDAAGGGDFCVALRSALARSGEIRLFAGAGIVAGSLPEAELRETRLKLRTLLVPLLEI